MTIRALERGNPNEGETVKQKWLSVSEENPGSQNISSDK